MTTLASNPILNQVQRHRGLIFPIGFISLLMVLLVPLPPQILDLLLVVNLTISVIILVSTIYAKGPLELSVFPSVLLAVTLFRLVLNVATTRLILTASDDNTPEEAMMAAGEVIQQFSYFVTGGSLAVGLIIFVIIFVIQFVVITKGATRVSEVAARFTLDAMPGKQMAIDADLNAGMIDEATARQRREAISQEADFYGAMDGASKFVRGDAIAGIIITIVNILGGVYVGMVEHGWNFGDTASLYTRLTIGDGLVSQVPAFIVSLGAGLIVTRSSSKNDLGEDMLGQLLGNPKVLFIAAGFLGAISLTGIPFVPSIILGGSAAGLGFILTRNNKQVAAAEAKKQVQQKQAAKEPEAVEKLLTVDAMELEVGYGLVRLVDKAKGGDLLERISLIRRQLAMELGIVVPPIRIRDNMQVEANDYMVKIRGQTVAKGEAFPDQFLAMDSGAAGGPITGGFETKEPAFGLPAYWITDAQKAEAELLNYTVVEASAVLATHITEVIRQYAHELLSRQEIRSLLDNLKNRSPALVEEVVPTQIKPGELQKVMQNLLRERVPVRDLETILETLGDYAGRTKDLDVLTEYARHALARTICKQYVDENDKLWCVTLDPAVEELINGHIQRTEGGLVNAMPPQTQQQILQKTAEKVAELTGTGRTAVILCGPQVRSVVRRLIEGSLPTVAVLSYNEIVSDVSVEAVGFVSLSG
ncbi:MAG: flagellar biosynthesis protein FlhA [Phycisphaerae bacterium]